MSIEIDIADATPDRGLEHHIEGVDSLDGRAARTLPGVAGPIGGTWGVISIMILPRVRNAERIRNRTGDPRRERRGLAAVELAVLLPMLVFMCMITIDFARVIYAATTLQNCARNGALYEFYTACGYSLPTGWNTLSTAVSSDAGSLTVTIPSTYGSHPNPYSQVQSTPHYVTVTVQCNFTLLTLGSDQGFPSIGGTMTLTQSVTMPLP